MESLQTQRVQVVSEGNRCHQAQCLAQVIAWNIRQKSVPICKIVRTVPQAVGKPNKNLLAKTT